MATPMNTSVGRPPMNLKGSISAKQFQEKMKQDEFARVEKERGGTTTRIVVTTNMSAAGILHFCFDFVLNIFFAIFNVRNVVHFVRLLVCFSINLHMHIASEFVIYVNPLKFFKHLIFTA